MRKLVFVFLAGLAIGCGDNNSNNWVSSPNAESELEENAPVDPAESDTSSIHSDTTTSGGMNRQNQYDTLK
jgi:hypothetical protein